MSVIYRRPAKTGTVTQESIDLLRRAGASESTIGVAELLRRSHPTVSGPTYDRLTGKITEQEYQAAVKAEIKARLARYRSWPGEPSPRRLLPMLGLCAISFALTIAGLAIAGLIWGPVR